MIESKTTIFKKACLSIVGAEHGYGWGKENQLEADCSGVVCYGLINAGYKIRCTADELRREIFVRSVTDISDLVDCIEPMALFFLSNTFQLTGNASNSRILTATHVMPLVGQSVFIHANARSDQIELIGLVDAIRYGLMTHRIVEARVLSWGACAFKDGELVYGLDEELNL